MLKKLKVVFSIVMVAVAILSIAAYGLIKRAKNNDNDIENVYGADEEETTSID